MTEDEGIREGKPAPLGATVLSDGMSFAVVAAAAQSATLVVCDPETGAIREEIALDPERHRSGDVWHVEVRGLDPPVGWAWKFDLDAPEPVAPPSGLVVLDPFARAVGGAPRWGSREGSPPYRFGIVRDRRGRRSRPPRPRHAPEDRVISELSVRGFTAHPSSGVEHPGTFAGLQEKLPALAELGITTVELLPVTEWDELEVRQRSPGGERLRNLWGYSPISFFAPKAGLAADGSPGGAVDELRETVDAFHREGIEVFLDVVVNHTAEKDLGPDDPVWSFRGIDPEGYYLLDEDDRPVDVTGCGNTVAVNDPLVRRLIVDSLRWWAQEIGIDGFRFDLAAVFFRGAGGEILDEPPILAELEADPVLRERTLVAEPWDPGGLYAVGRFARRGRWSEWNGPFRDGVRRFVRGDRGMARRLATRLAGSEDLYRGSDLGPAAGVNFVTCHDGFTLADLVSYDKKHNLPNGEGNRDGADANFSWNCGVEGPTGDPNVLRLRHRQRRNLVTLLVLAQGTPMLLAGDEMGRTQEGNNNAWCRDDPIGWVDWSRLELDEERDFRRFVRELVAFRRRHPALRRRRFLTGRGSPGRPRPDVAWYGTGLGRPAWNGRDGRRLAMHLAGEHAPERDDDLWLGANSAPASALFELPPPPEGRRWLRVVDTARASPGDIAVPGRENVVDGRRIEVEERSCVLLRSGRPEG